MSLTKTEISQNAGIKPVLIIAALFFIFGFVTWLNSVLIPYLKIACELNNFESYLVAFSFYISYLVMAIPSAWVLKLSGYKKGMALGLLMMALGALIFIPAAISRAYPLFLTGLFIQGTGLAVLQTAANPYTIIIGPAKSAARRISMMGIGNKIAGALAPVIMGAITLRDIDGLKMRLLKMDGYDRAAELDLLAERVIMPYAILTVVLVVLAVLIFLSGLPEIEAEGLEDQTADTGMDLKCYPHLLLGVLTMFLYVGVEVIAGDSIISYGSFQGIPLHTAKFFTTYTLMSMIAGYIIGIICIPRYLSQENALKISAITGIVFSLVALFTNGYVSVMFIALLGLANALMWPAIWPMAIAGLGRLIRIGSSMLIMAVSGGAILPLLYGRLADGLNPQLAYTVLLPSYAFIMYYAVKGHKLKST
jgi:FHS family L-fucose permease-like MFS transporter